MADEKTAEDLLKEGDLQAALEALQGLVRADPADSKLRIFLFQLLSVMGAWDRALNQLNVAGSLDPQALPMVQAYRETLQCEVLRQHVFAGDRQPLVFGEPERWIALAFESARLLAQGNYDQALALRSEAYESAPLTSGRVNGEDFEWIADGDSRIGPFLEVIVNGGFYWVPFHRIAKLELGAPADLRDLVWMPANVTWANGGEAVVFVPSRYPGILDDTPPECLLARRTDWREAAPDTFLGSGQRVLVTDTGEYSLLEIRTLELDTTDAGEQSDDDPEG